MSTSTQTGIAPRTDFQLVSQSLVTFKDETGKLQNAPALSQGNAILDILREMREDIRIIREDMRVMRRDINDIRTEMRSSRKASNINSAARVENSRLSKRTDALSPFVAYSTDLLIQGFPATPNDLARLNSDSLDSILNNLELPDGGGLNERRRRVSQHIGCFEVV